MKNLQGDIVGIVDSNGTEVVKYSYDVWGLPMFATEGSMASTLGKANPLRYRGYVYDEETGLYYLRSRYYNPEWGRFLNADTIQEKGNLLAHNLYAYCINNPVGMVDPEGKAFAIALGISFGAFVAAAVATVAVIAVAVVVSDAIVQTVEAVEGWVEGFGKDDVQRELTASNEISTSTTYTDTAVSDTVATKQNNERKTHMHHIVAKGAWRAAPARRILMRYGIDPKTSPLNLVPVPAEKHAHLHTAKYYAYVNSCMLTASFRGKQAVLRMLESLGGQIMAGTIIF